MDDTSPGPQGPTPARGGQVEPLAPLRLAATQAPENRPGLRYEVWDPFAEVMYRSDRFDAMTSKADELGTTRISGIGPQGERIAIHKTHGRWEAPQTDSAPSKAPTVRQEHMSGRLESPGEAGSPATDRATTEAERLALRAKLEAQLSERYVIKRPLVAAGYLSLGQTEYRFRGDISRIAFTASTLRLATDTNSPSVARSMVDVAETRGWQALRVSGGAEFRRAVWIEAASRGVRTVGYEPLPADLEAMQRARDARLVNRLEPVAEAAAQGSSATKESARGGGGRKAVLAAIEAILVAKGVSIPRRELVLKAAATQLPERIRKGQTPKVKLHDVTAPSHAPSPNRATPSERVPERPSPTR